MIKPVAVLFDFDGVVVDSFVVHFSAWANAYDETFGHALLEMPEDLEGKSPIQISERLSEIGGDVSKASLLYNIKGNKLHANTTPPNLLKGVRELTQLLKNEAIPYGIASNATKQFVGNSIQQLNIDFKTYFGLEDYNFPKPNPEPYIKLAIELGISKADFSEVIVFEDSITGATAAVNAGMFVVGIETQHNAETLKKAGCKYSFPTLLEAQKLFN